MVCIIGDKNSGRNHLGKVLACEQHVPLIDISLNELTSRSSADVEELLKNISEVKRAVIFLGEAESLNAAKDKDKHAALISFIEQLKNNKGLTILLSTTEHNPNIKNTTEIQVQPPNSIIYKEILDKHATHLTEEGKGILVDTVYGESIIDVIEQCKYVEKYWEDHCENSSKVKAPLKLYLNVMQKLLTNC